MASDTAQPRRAIVDEVPEAFLDRRTPVVPRHAFPTDAPDRKRNGRKWFILVGIGIGCAALLTLLCTLIGPRLQTIFLTEATKSLGTASASASTKLPAKAIDVDDTTIEMPGHWELYHDGKTNDGRRVIRVRDAQANVSLQVSTLASLGAEARTACDSLATDQAKGYTLRYQIGPRALSSAGGSAVLCGFEGTKEGEQQATSVTFTLVTRQSDNHVLVLRSMTPTALAQSAVARTEIAAMSCEASTTFGDQLPLCSATLP